MHSFRFLLAMGLSITLLGACKEGSVSGIGGGGTGGTGGTTAAGGSGGQCQGNAGLWAKITSAPLECTKSSDCCVVFNGCLSQAQIVRAVDYTDAQTAWPYCPDVCVGCIAPAVNVACDNGTCVGETIDLSTNPPQDLMQNHCGVDAVPVGTPSALTKFGCGS